MTSWHVDGTLDRLVLARLEGEDGDWEQDAWEQDDTPEWADDDDWEEEEEEEQEEDYDEGGDDS